MVVPRTRPTVGSDVIAAIDLFKPQDPFMAFVAVTKRCYDYCDAALWLVVAKSNVEPDDRTYVDQKNTPTPIATHFTVLSFLILTTPKLNFCIPIQS